MYTDLTMQLTDKNGNIFGWSGLEIIGPDGKPKTIDQGLTSVGLSMPSAFAVSNSPLTSNGTIGVTGAGTNLEYIDGTGALRTFPSLSGYVTAVTASLPLSSSGGTTPNITISQASGTDDGYLSSTDWLTFNSKQPAGNYITALSGEATGSGPGTASVTLNNASVTAKVLTGVNITGGSISASDSILTAFGKLQNQINGLIGSSVYQGVWNASTNNPTLTSGVGTRGYYYIVNVAGSTNLDGITDWNVGDWAIFDGTAWQQVDNTDSVTSVNGQTGAVSLTTDNISEGAVNQYFTQLRARQSLTLSTTGNSGAATYNNTTGVLNIPIYTDQFVGTVTSVDMSVPTGFTISGNPITSAGTLALGFNSDYSLPTIASQLEWDQAYDDMIVSASVTGTTTKTLTLNQQDGGTITASWTDYDTAPVTSVFGRTGDVVAQSGDYTTTLVPEGTNLYYTDARSRAAISSSALGLTYNNSNGVFSLTSGYSIPTTANQSNWSTAYNRSITGFSVNYGVGVTSLILTQQDTSTISLALIAGAASQGKFVYFNGSNLAYTSIAATAPLSLEPNNFTFSIAQATISTDGYLSSTDWNTFNNKQNAITLTTTGTSGPATLIGNTLNIPQYQDVITNPVTGTGTANYVAKWTSSSNISSGIIYDNGTNVGIGYSTPNYKLEVAGDIYANAGNGEGFKLNGQLGVVRVSGTELGLLTSNTERLRITSGGSLLLGTTTIAGPYGNPKMLIVGGSTPLIVSNGDNAGTYLQINTGAANGVVNLQADARTGDYPPLTITTGGSEKMRITPAGSVGIGNSSPGYKLDVAGNFRATNGIVNEANHDNTRFDNILPASVNGSGAGTVQMGWWVSEPGISWNNGGFGYNVTNNGASPYGFGRINTSLGQAYMRFEASGFLYFYNTNTSGTRFETMTLSDAGAIRFNQYGSGTKTGTRAYDLAVDSSGNLIEVPVGAGTVTGSGTANYVARWTSSSNISTGVLYDNGTNVGIGTASPAYKLDVAGDIALPYGSILRASGGTYTKLIESGYNGSSDYVNLYTVGNNAGNATAKITMLASGNIGIGTNTPAQKLEVNGNIKLSSTVGQTSTPSYIWLGNDFSNGATRDKLKIYLYNSGTEQYGFSVGSNADVQYHSNGIHDFYIANSNAVRINSNGHVGIGTTAPSQKLSVIGNIYANGGFIGYRNDGGIGLEVNGGDMGPGTFIAKFNDYNNTSKVVINGVGDVGIGTTTPTKYMSSTETLMSIVNSNVASLYLYSTTGHLYNMSSISNGDLFWYDVSAGTERMRLTGSGNFGIGTSSPAYKLDITASSTSDGFRVNLGGTSKIIANGDGVLAWGASANQGALTWDGSKAIVMGQSGNALSLGANGTWDRLYITTSGNVGIGTTSPQGRLAIDGGDIRFNYGNSTSSYYLWLNKSASADGGIILTRDNSLDWQIVNNTGTGDLGFYSYGSGTQALYIKKSNGNVGIGTTNPTVKLEVAGQAFVDKFQYTQGIQIGGGDLNDVTTAGFYAGSALTNAPDNTGWYWVTVERHSDSGWVHQLATSYGAGNTENLMYSRVKMNNSTWTAWKKISYSTDTPTATSVYDLLPNARVDYTWVGQVIDGTWVDIFTRANNVLTSGTWIVNMYVSDFSTGGAHYTYNYSGTFTWYDGGTNQSGTPAASEIALHRMGHAANNTVLYLRTTEETAADGGDGKFQITGNYSHTSNTTITFKFVKII
jgi:hypothetical protein